MKKLLLAAGMLLTMGIAPATAQYYQIPFLNAGRNPGSLNTDSEYPVGGGLPTGWTTLFTGTAATLTTPVWSSTATIPFTFQFNGQAVTSYKVASSGVLTFNTAATTVPPATNVALPSAQIPDQSVCVWGIGATAGDYIITKTFGTAPNRQHWVQFNSYSKGGNAAIFTYWSIVLEEGTNNIYIVDQRTNVTAGLDITAGVQVNATTAVQVAGSPTLESGTVSDPTPADNSYWQFAFGTQPTRDLKAVASTTNSLVGRNSPLPITGTLQNMGTQAVTSYTVNYKVNNGATVSGAVTGASVAPLAEAAFTHPTPWTPTTRGTYALKVWLSNPNGQPDERPANDTINFSVNVADSTMTRMVLLEGFTSSTCGPCNPGNANVLAVNQANRRQYVQIKYQQNFPAPGNDPYYTAEAGSRIRYYFAPATSIYIPYMVLDGGANGNYADNSNSYTQADFLRAKSKPAIARVQAAYTRTGNTITAYARVRALDAINSANLAMHVVITERRTTQNVRTNGETLFYDVAKKMLPSETGTSIPALTSGQTVTLAPQSYTFPAPTTPVTSTTVENFDSLRVIVFLQDRITKEVYQATAAVLNGPLGTQKAQGGVAFELAPNPTAGRTSLFVELGRTEAVHVEVLDALGRRVSEQTTAALSSGSHELPLDLAGKAPGLYTVHLTTSKGVSTRKLVLQ